MELINTKYFSRSVSFSTQKYSIEKYAITFNLLVKRQTEFVERNQDIQHGM